MMVSLILTAVLPPGVTIEEWRTYVEDEVRANVGSRHPSDPLFHLDRDRVDAVVWKVT